MSAIAAGTPAPLVDPVPPPQPQPQDKVPAVLASSDLLQGGRTVEIRHNGELYRLQATRQGKLLLTK
jgi:hemin uptake protein HemP